MTDHDVVIAGGGPAGLMLAGELALAGVDVAIVERRTSQDLGSSRAGGLHSRTIEVLDQRGIAGRFLAEGQVMQIQAFAGAPLDISDFPTRHPYGLALWQRDFERILRGWVDELAVPIHGGRAVTGCTPGADDVAVQLSDGGTVRAQYLVGCDGGRSAVRKAAGIEFAGFDPTTAWLIAEADLHEPAIGVRREGGGIGPIDRVTGRGPFGIVLPLPSVDAADPPTVDDLRALLIDAYGTDFGLREPSFISRFDDTTRQATAYRAGRVLLAGDAAHVHPPQGGQGLNTGVQDAVNLGWKLARVVDGTAPDALLDSYHRERHPVGARVQRTSLAQIALTRTDARTEALLQIVRTLVGTDEARKQTAGMMSGLDIHYDLGAGHPLLGRRMPDRDLVTNDGTHRLFERLHTARPLLLNLGAPGAFAVSAWPHVPLVDATAPGPWELPVLGTVDAPEAVLVRPDGHVAWVGAAGDPGVEDALTTWCGPPTR